MTFPTATPNLALPYLAAAQAQKHVTHNEALRQLDTLVQLAVLDIGLAAPLAAPVEGERHIVGAAPTGAWAGQANAVAIWQDGGWAFVTPRAGWIAFVSGADKLYVYRAGGWSAYAPEAAPLNPASLIGVNATADSGNRLSVASSASLFNHEGGSHRLKINKAGAADTGSLVFQTGYSGRAEMGLAGADDFSFKVSADGATWKSALVIDRATGAVSFPQTTLAASFAVQKDGVAVMAGAQTLDLRGAAVSVADAGGGVARVNLAPSSVDPLELTKYLRLAMTNSSQAGVVYKGSARFLHNYAVDGSNGANTFLGLNAGNFTLGPNGGGANLSCGNTGLGAGALSNLTTGYDNTAIGKATGGAVTSGASNTLIGANVAMSLTTGSSNTVLGVFCGYALTSGVGNNIFGASSGNALATSGNNCLFGNSVGPSLTGWDTVAIGSGAGWSLTTGGGNTLIGRNCGSSLTTGSYNTVVGANVQSLPAGTSNAVVLADGQGNRRVNIDAYGNVSLNVADQTGGGRGVLALAACALAPTANPTGAGLIYVEAGALKYRGPNGTVTTLAAA